MAPSLFCYSTLTLNLTLTVFQAFAVPTPNHTRVTLLHVTVTEYCDHHILRKSAARQHCSILRFNKIISFSSWYCM